MRACLSIVAGSIAALGLTLFLRSFHEETLSAPADTVRSMERALEEDPSPVFTVTLPVPAVPTPEPWLEDDSVASVVAELRRSNGMGPAAKGARDDQLHQLRTRLTPANVAEVAHRLLPQDLVSPTGSVVLECWLAMEPLAAGAWIAAQPDATDHHAWLVAAAATKEPDLLARLCQGLDHSSWAQAFLDHCGRELLRRSPAAAVSLAESLPPGERRTRLLETIACDWLLRNPGPARAWIDGVGNDVLRQRLVLAGAPSHASTDPLGAIEWLLAQSPDAGVLDGQIQTIARHWLPTADPDTAVRLNQWLADADSRSETAPRSP